MIVIADTAMGLSGSCSAGRGFIDLTNLQEVPQTHQQRRMRLQSPDDYEGYQSTKEDSFRGS